ncbi:MAG: sigma-54-dependent Fis family transcriptional regulator [Blastocatellia bacterium]|nr:sigma-54-dependent Fis family transcriptional regulator [Blastocatellia bacterium]
MSCPDQSTSTESNIVSVPSPMNISCLGATKLAELLSEVALRDASVRERLRKLVSVVDGSKNPFQNPLTAIVPRQSLYECMTRASPALGFVFDTIRRYAISRAPVLITGESGTAKELAARAIHYGSASRNGPFIAISCASMPVAAIGPELFGYEKSVSARNVRKIGRIEMAAGGSLFLDAISNLSLELQTRLLRFLQEGTIERIGGREPIEVTTRVIVATRVDLRKAVGNHRFRGDLFDRLNGLTLNLPPLQDQGNDILLMAKFFLQQFAQEAGRETFEMLPDIEKPIPGKPLEFTSIMQQDSIALSQDLAGTRASVEAALIRATLKRNRYNIKQSAKEMGISRVTLYRAIHKYGIALERSCARTISPPVGNGRHPYPVSPLMPPAHSGR